MDKKLKDTNTTLRDVNKLLKFDPQNTELLSQKQKLLADAIENTEKRLEDLREASKKAQQMLESGDLGKDKYDALQREIINTEQNLQKLKTESSNTAKSLEASGKSLESFSKSAEKASSKLEGASKKAGALLAAVSATVPATEELRRDLSFLEQNAIEVGSNIDEATEAFKVFNAVSGETDSSVEGISNLLQANFTGNNLQRAVELLSGAVTRFPDTLKVESLADSLQETLATGTATGQFGELLDRLGIGADNFSTSLEKCTTAADKQNYALKVLSDAGLKDTYDGWRENNEEIVDYEDAMFDLQQATGELAEAIAPLVTKIAEIGTAGINAFNQLPDSVKNIAIGLTTTTAVASPALTAISKITTATGKLTTKSSNLYSVLMNHPYGAIAGVALGLVGVIWQVVDSINAETKAAEEFAEKNEEQINGIESQGEVADFYIDKIEELAAVDEKSATQKELLQTYVDKLNESTEGLNLSYDAEKDKLNQTTDAIREKIKARQDEAIAEAYIQQSDEALKKYAETQLEVTEIEQRRTDAQDKLNSMVEEGRNVTEQDKATIEQLTGTIESCDTQLGDLSEAQRIYYEEATKASNAAAMQQGAFDDLLQEAGKLKTDLPAGLVEALNAGKYTLPSTVEELNDLITFQQAVNDAGLSGSEIVDELSYEISTGKTSVKEAVSKLNSAATTEANKLPGKMKKVGENAGEGLSIGIKSATAAVMGSAAGIVANAISAAKKEADSHSPSKKMIKEGHNMGDGLAIGLEESAAVVARASENMAAAALTPFDVPEMSAQIAGQNATLANLSGQNFRVDNNVVVMVGNEQFKGYIVKTANSGIGQVQRENMRARGAKV